MRKVDVRAGQTVTTEALVFDRRSKNYLTFYNTCCGIAGVPTFIPDEFSGAAGPLGGFLIQGTDYCSGQTVELAKSSPFSSGNTAVATVSTAGGVAGVAPGSTSSNGFISFSQQKTADTCVTKNASSQKPTKVQVPTSLSVTIGNKIAHNGDSAGVCPGPACIPVCYGYERRLTYTVLDQFTPPKPIQNATMSATEVVTKVSSNPSDAGGNFTITVAVGSDGKFGDILAFCAGVPPPPQPGEFIKDKQAITVTLKGVGYPVRTNCADFESNDVTLTDVTGNPGATCQ